VTVRLNISLGRLKVILITVISLLGACGLFAEYCHYILEIKSELIYYFSLSEEKNFPTWWSSTLLLACGVVLWGIARTKTRQAGEFKRHWAALAVIFCYMSIDELVEIHEWLGSIPGIHELSGVAFYGWVVPVGILVAVFALSYLKFVVHLPPATRRKVVLAGVIYVGGALGIELILGAFADQHGEDSFAWTMISWVEEMLEMMGSSLFLYALLEYLGRSAPDLRIAIGSGRD
jgi:hypothetical protein